jgi:hypothetical protein
LKVEQRRGGLRERERERGIGRGLGGRRRERKGVRRRNLKRARERKGRRLGKGGKRLGISQARAIPGKICTGRGSGGRKRRRSEQLEAHHSSLRASG